MKIKMSFFKFVSIQKQSKSCLYKRSSICTRLKKYGYKFYTIKVLSLGCCKKVGMAGGGNLVDGSTDMRNE